MNRFINNVDGSLREYIESLIIPAYREFEKSHNDDHINTVIENSFDIVEELNLDVDLDMVYAIAAYHDIGIPFGRDDHHLSSARIMMADDNLDKWFSKEDKVIMKEAIEDHRASSCHPPRSLYGKIVAEADRDIEPERIVRRCVQFEANAHSSESYEEIVIAAKNHLIEKYGENGYLKLWLASEKNRKGLDTLREWLKTGIIDEKISDALSLMSNK